MKLRNTTFPLAVLALTLALSATVFGHPDYNLTIFGHDGATLDGLTIEGQQFGYGSTNGTSDGGSKNRRAEIQIIVNKGDQSSEFMSPLHHIWSLVDLEANNAVKRDGGRG